MMDVKVTGIDALQSKLNDLQSNQLPYAIKEGLNQTALEIQKAEIEEMRKVFDRPTPYTLGSTFVRYATKQKLTAETGFRGQAGRGIPAPKYLAPQVYGGDRNLKRFEKALQAIGVLPSGMYCVPGKGATLDAYGNFKTTQLLQILSYFKAFGEQGYRKNMTDKRRDKMAKGTKKTASLAYFVSQGRGSVSMTGKPQHLPPGIYARHGFSFGTAIKSIIMFVKKPGYRKRYPFEETAEKVANTTFSNNLHFAIGKAINTAK